MTLPNGLTSIGDSVFKNCLALTSVTIPNSVTSIGDSAFYGCDSLTSVTIPNSVTSIGASAFYGCTGLTSVSIPSSVTSIGKYAFEECGALTMATVHNASATFGSEVFHYAASGFTLRGHSGSTAEAYANSNGYSFQAITTEMAAPDFTLPAAMTRIEAEAFSGAKMTVVYIPDGVTFLGSKAFANCLSLTQIRIPASITTIPPDTFQGITKSKLTIFGTPGSAAETFATNAGIKFEIE